MLRFTLHDTGILTKGFLRQPDPPTKSIHLRIRRSIMKTRGRDIYTCNYIFTYVYIHNKSVYMDICLFVHVSLS